MAKRRRSTRAKRQRGGFLESITNAFQSASDSVSNALNGTASPPPPPPAGESMGVNAVNDAAGAPVATNAANQVQDAANGLPPLVNGGASKALGLPPPAPGTNSVGGRRRRSRKTKRRTQRHGGKYY